MALKTSVKYREDGAHVPLVEILKNQSLQARTQYLLENATGQVLVANALTAA